MTIDLSSAKTSLQHGDGSYKIFGMENFGNTCYCNLILQCLYYTEPFRINLLTHNREAHPQRTSVPGVKPHGFTAKYEALVQKKIKEVGKGSSSLAASANSSAGGGGNLNGTSISTGSTTGAGVGHGGSISGPTHGTMAADNGVAATASLTPNLGDDEKSRFGKRGSIFGIKFSGGYLNQQNGGQNSNIAGNGILALNAGSLLTVHDDTNSKHKTGVILPALDCEALSVEQQIRIRKSKEILMLPLLVTQPVNGVSSTLPVEARMAFLQLSLMLLGKENGNGTNGANGANGANGTNANNTNTNFQGMKYGVNDNQGSIVIVGIPYPDHLTNPNGNPTTDQRKRAALVNGPILNLDVLLDPLFRENPDTALLYALRDIFESMVENNLQTGVVLPNWFITKLKEKNYLFRQNNMHHDAHEFCNYLINDIIENLDREGVKDNWCTNIFKGLVTNETKCLSCETITLKEESFLDLSIDVPPGQSAYLLTHLLNNFLKLEVLRHQNKFYCNTCLLLQEATKTIKIKQVPEVLIINLKRFKYDEKVDRMVKLFDLILYLQKLRLFNTRTGSKGENSDFLLFELYALVVHIGGGPMHGHYVSLCKIKSQIWLLFDDETVEIVDDSYVLRFFGDGPGLASAYILFYRKCDTETSLSHSEGGIDAGENFDFGFNVDSMFHGCDELLTDLGKSPAISAERGSLVVDPLTQSGTLLISSNDTVELKKASLFKKNFTLKTFNEGNTIESIGSANSDLEKRRDLAVEKKQEKKQEKKSSWGLKRRDTKTEKDDSSVPERRKSMFGFKRK